MRRLLLVLVGLSTALVAAVTVFEHQQRERRPIVFGIVPSADQHRETNVSHRLHRVDTQAPLHGTSY